MIKKLYQKYKTGFWQAVKFQAVGAINFGVDYGILMLLNVVLGWPLVLSNLISYSCGVVNSFVLNRYWTFHQRLKFFSRHFAVFVFVNLISLGVNTLAVYILADLYSLPNILAKLIATVFSFTVNFAGNKLLVFNQPGPEQYQK